MSLKILIADDHPLVLAGVRGALAQVEDMEVVGEAHSGIQVLSLLGRTNPDVVLTDIRMPGLDGFTYLERIRTRHPSVQVIVFSASSGQDQIAAAFRCGATAYIVKSVNSVDLPSAIRQAHERTVYHPYGLEARDKDVDPLNLTEREQTILTAVARGLSNKAIGKDLWVSEQTVKFHLTNIYRKLEVANRTAAARVAQEHGLVASCA